MIWKIQSLFRRERTPVQADAGAYFQRGKGHVSRQQWRLAEECFREVTRLDPNHADAYAFLGNVLRQLGEFDSAIAAYDCALAIRPRAAELYYNRGTLLLQLNELQSALQSFDSALTANPALAAAHRRRGDSLWQLGDMHAAEASYREAVALMPDDAEVNANLGALQMALGFPKEALASFDDAIRLKPDDARVFSNRAQAQAQLGLVSEARMSHDHAVQLNPKDAQIHFNRGAFLTERDEWQAASESYLAGIRLNPDFADAHGNLGLSQHEMGQVDLAHASYARALTLNPRLASVLNNRGNLFRANKRFTEAKLDYREALALDPSHVEAHYNMGQLALLQGDFDTGWREYEWRARIDEARRVVDRIRPEPAWFGEPVLRGKKIVLHAEQGYGDTIQFCRYASLVSGLGAHVILEAQPELIDVLATLEGVSELVPVSSATPHADFQCSLMSLPGAFKTRLETIPGKVPYLYADPKKIEAWEKILGPRARPRVGLVWSGNPLQRNDHNRSMALSELIGHLPSEFDYYSVQKDIREADRETLSSFPCINVCGPRLHSFADTAALLETLDLVISVDTSVAHLSCALGKQTWLLLCYVADWRYLLDRKDSPWYPTATLYRQSAPNDWDGIMRQMKKDLTCWGCKQG